MYACIISGWEETIGFGKTRERAIEIATSAWKKKCADDVQDMMPEEIKACFGMNTYKITDGLCIDL